MKKTFGVSFNVFEDSIETLPACIKNIRAHVDHINIVYQKVSNLGIPAILNIEKIVMELKNQGLIDVIFEYKPSLKQNGHFNEISKRNIGLLLAQEANIDLFMTMDQDEAYLDEQFEWVKQYYLDNDIEAGYCQMQTYYKSPSYCLEIPEEYYVSLFFKLNKYSFFKLAAPAPVTIDPSRNISTDKFKIFKRSEIEMHHFSYLRKDISKKFLNSSARVNFNDSINDLIEYYNDWKPSMKALFAGSPNAFHKLKKVNTWDHIDFGFDLLEEKLN